MAAQRTGKETGASSGGQQHDGAQGRKPSSARPEQKPHATGAGDIDLERVLYDPEYRQAVQEALPPDDRKPPQPGATNTKPDSRR